MIRSIRTHTGRILRTIPAQITFFILLGFALYNFIHNVIANADVQYVSQMIDPLKLLTLSDLSDMQRPSSQAGYFLMLLYPILVSFPIVSSWIADKSSGNVSYIEARTGRTKFWFGKLIAVFLATFIIFALPFFLELLLNTICFDLSSDGDANHFIDDLSSEMKYFLPRLWAESRYLYVVVMLVLWGAASGVLGCFAFACSTFPFMRFRILNFLPVYVLLYSGLVIQGVFCRGTVLFYVFLFRMFFISYTQKVDHLLNFLIMAGVLLVSVLIIFFRSRRDQLS